MVTCLTLHSWVASKLSLCLPFPTPFLPKLPPFKEGLPTSSIQVLEVAFYVMREMSQCPSVLIFPMSSDWNSQETYAVVRGPSSPGGSASPGHGQVTCSGCNPVICRDNWAPTLELGIQSQARLHAGNLFLVLHCIRSRSFYIFFDNA